MIDTGLVVVVTITFTMLLCVLILLSYDFEQWCPQVSMVIITAQKVLLLDFEYSFAGPSCRS